MHFVAVLLLLMGKVNANTITSKSITGNWNSTSSWVGGAIPSSTDSVVIASGAVITMDKNYTTTVDNDPSLTISGTLKLTSNTSLLNYTSVVINCPGNIYWSNNSDLTFTDEVEIVINGTGGGLQPTAGNGNGSQRLIVGAAIIAVSSDHANNADYSFEEFNGLGGLPRFKLSGLSPVCYGSSISVKMTPSFSNYNSYCVFSWATGSGTITPSSGTYTGAATVTVTPSGTVSTQTTYTVKCKIFKTDGTSLLASKTLDIKINPMPTASAAFSATPCLGNNATINATTANTTNYQWQLSSDGGSSWTDISNSSPYSGATTGLLSLSATNISMAGYYYRIKASNTTYPDYSGSYCNAASGAVPLQFTNQWLGTTNTNYSKPSNWINNALPVFNTGCPTVAIPAVSTLPQLTTGVIVTNLSIAPGASLDLNGYSLEIDGTFSGSSTGYLKGNSNSSLTIGADDVTNINAGTLYFDAANNNLKTFTIRGAKSIALGNALNIAAGTYASPGKVTAKGVLAAGGFLTLKSDVNGDAMVASSTGSITGDVTVERYIPARRAWRLLTFPFSSSTQSINDAWQEGATPNPNTSTQNNPNPGYGTEITYDNNTGHGFDVNTTVNPSLKVWDNSTNAWSAYSPYTNTTHLTDYPAYCLFVRGSRAINLALGTYAIPDATILRAKGQLNETGSSIVKTYSGSAGKCILVGNPFASAINVQNILDGTKGSGFSLNKLWVWDAKIGGNSGVGGYVTYSSGVWAPANGSYSGSSPVIQSGQAFMVQLTGNSASMTFQQNDKSLSEGNVNGLQANNEQAPGTGATSLKAISAGNLRNTKNEFSYPVVHANLMIASGNSLSLADGVTAVFSNNLSKTAADRNAAKNWNTNENMALVRNGQTFAIEFRPRPESTDTMFFRLYLFKGSPYALQIFGQNISDSLKGRAWLVDNYLNTRTEVHLADTSVINFQTNTDTNSYRNRFMLVYVRNAEKQQTGNNSKISNTDVSYISVFPNPVIGRTCNMLISNNLPAGKYQALIYDDKGMLKLAKEVEYDGYKSNYKLTLPASLNQGVYKLALSKDNTALQTISFILSE